MTISGGAVVNSFASGGGSLGDLNAVSSTGGQQNALVITGPGSKWNAGFASVRIGNGGDKSLLRIENAGTAENLRAFNVNNNGDDSQVIVTGSGSSLSTLGALQMRGENARLIIENGGVYEATNTNRYGDTSVSHRMIVSGLGSRFDATGAIDIGENGSGHLLAVDDEATFEAGLILVGDNGSDSRACVDGPGTIMATDHLELGNATTGNQLLISNSALLQITSATPITVNTGNRIQLKGGHIALAGNRVSEANILLADIDAWNGSSFEAASGSSHISITYHSSASTAKTATEADNFAGYDGLGNHTVISSTWSDPEQVWVYFTDEGSIFRANINGTDVSNLHTPASPATPRGIQATENYLYWADSSNGIYRSDLDGSNATQLVSTSVPLHLHVTDTDIYWTSPFDGIFRSALDGSNVTLVLPHATHGRPIGVYVDDTHIYTTGSFGLRKTEIANTSNTSIIESSHPYEGLDFSGSKLYLAVAGNNPGLFRCNLDGSGLETLSTFDNRNERPHQVSVYQEDLFYGDSLADRIGKVPTNGGADVTRIRGPYNDSGSIWGVDIAIEPVVVTEYTVTLHPGSNGTIDQANSGVDYVATLTENASFPAVTVTPDISHNFTGWSPALPATVTGDFESTAQYSIKTFQVNFNLGSNGTRTGGGALSQTINYGSPAVAPIFEVASGFGFTGWDVDFDSVTSNLTVTAEYGVDLEDAGTNDDAVSNGGRSAPPGSTETVEVGSLTVTEGSEFELGENETLILNEGPLTINEGSTFSGNGTIIGSVINSGLVRIPVIGLPPTVNRGVLLLFIETATTITETITMESGIVDIEGPEPVVINTPKQMNSGTLSMDASLEVTGEYEQTSTGSLRLFISGPDAGVSYSQLITGDDVTLDGSLQIVLQPENLGYLPDPGDVFDLILTDPSSSIMVQPGLSVEVFLVDGQTAAFDEDGIGPLASYNSPLGAADPDDLLVLPSNYFTVTTTTSAEGPVLRATYDGPDLNDYYNERPTDIQASANTISEGDPAGTQVATLSSTGGAAGAKTYTLVTGEGSTDNDNFSINGVALETTRPIDFETDPEREIRIRVTDTRGRFIDKIFDVIITNVTFDDDDEDRLTEAEEVAIGTEKLKADTDGDGYDDGDEFIDFGTDPTQTGSAFRYVGDVQVTETSATIGWETVAGRLYTIQGSNDIGGNSWVDLPDPVLGDGSPTTQVVDLTISNYTFFRLKVVQAP